jgi:hypothetical protein
MSVEQKIQARMKRIHPRRRYFPDVFRVLLIVATLLTIFYIVLTGGIP